MLTVPDPSPDDDWLMQSRDSAARVPGDRGVESDLAPRSTESQIAGASAPRAPDPSAELDREVFLDILTHELRTPVTTIYGGAELLARRDLEPSRRRALADDVRSEADRLFGLVEDLVVLVRSERNAIRPVGEPIALGRLVTTAIEQALARHPEAHIRLLGTNDAAADGADAVLVGHVLRNLLENAVRYGPATGPIEVIVSETPIDVSVRVVHRGEPPHGSADPFALSAGAASTAAVRSGAGISLNVADRLVTAMGGRTWAIPAIGGGTEIGFALSRTAGTPTANA